MNAADRPIARPIVAALAFAADLDVTLAAACDDDTYEAIHAVGNLTGGLSTFGMLADLQQHLSELSSPVAAGLPDNEPLNGWQLEAEARDWLRKAREIMERVRVAAPAMEVV